MWRGETRMPSKYLSYNWRSQSMCSPQVTVPRRGQGMRFPASSWSRGVWR
jgi:hypothetical protein